MPRFIDADKIEIPCMEEENDEKWMKAAIDATPTEDAIEVIRCEDCEHYFGQGLFCAKTNSIKKKLDYCSDAVPRLKLIHAELIDAIQNVSENHGYDVDGYTWDLDTRMLSVFFTTKENKNTQEKAKQGEDVEKSDLINKQDAIDALGERPLAWMQDEYETGLQNQYDADLAAIQSVPSVPSDICDRAESAWVLNHLTQLWECINCHEQEEKITDFCPHCGAKITEVIQF